MGRSELDKELSQLKVKLKANHLPHKLMMSMPCRQDSMSLRTCEEEIFYRDSEEEIFYRDSEEKERFNYILFA